MSILENQIPIEQRFTSKNNQEFHVFSTESTEAKNIQKWISVEWPYKVLIDAETYTRLRNRRIEWKFDDNKSLEAVIIKAAQQEVKDE